ncbi:MAG TPA: hypothetical protein VII96_12265 [Acidimicrobiales bacterium]
MSTLAFAAVVVGLFVESRNRKADIARLDTQRIEEQSSEHARQVGAFIEATSIRGKFGDPEPGTEGRALHLTVVNAGKLPVRNFEARVVKVGDSEVTALFEPIAVVVPGEFERYMEVVGAPDGWRLEIEFDDDAGTRWSKYGPHGLTRSGISAGHSAKG